MAKLLHLGIEKEQVLFALRSIFRNFVPKFINYTRINEEV